MLRKSYNACMLVYMPKVNCSYLEIHSDWFSEYVGDQLGKIYDCVIAEIVADYRQLNNI